MGNTGKFYGWRMLGVLWVLYFLMQGLVLYGQPVVNTFMIQSTGMSRSVLGTGASLFILTQGLSSPLVAKAINTKGIRFTFVLGAALLLVSSLLMASVVDTPLKFILVFGVLAGIGIGFGGMFSVQAGVTYWFRARRALAMSIALTGSGVGGFVAGNVLGQIIRISGGNWKIAWWFLSVTCLLSMIIAAKYVINRPEDIGQQVDGGLFEDPEKEKRVSRVFKVKKDVELAVVLRTQKFWFIIVTLLALRFAYNLCVAHGIIHLLDQGVPQMIAATSVGGMTLASIFGRLGAGVISDKIEPRTVWFWSMVIFLGGFLNLFFAETSIHVILYAVLLGVGFGASYVCSATILGNYYGANTFPSIMGIANPLQMIAGAISPIIAGIIYDSTMSYSLAFIIGTVFIVLGIVTVFFATPPSWKPIIEEASTSKI